MTSKKLTFVQSQDVETQVFDWGKLSWLSEPSVTAAERFSAGVVKLEPGKGHERDNHPYSEEILYVVRGEGRQVVELPEGIVEEDISSGTLVHIPTALFHSTINTGTDTLEMVAIYAPFGPEAELRRMDGVTLEPPQRPKLED